MQRPLTHSSWPQQSSPPGRVQGAPARPQQTWPALVLPQMRGHFHGRHHHQITYWAVLAHGNHVRAFALTVALVMSSFLLAPYFAPFLVGNVGLGYMIEYARQNFDTTGVFAGIVVATALVLAINGVLALVDRRVNAWRPVDRHMVI